MFVPKSGFHTVPDHSFGCHFFRNFVQKPVQFYTLFSGIAWILGYLANRACCVDVPNAFVRFWEADLRDGWTAMETTAPDTHHFLAPITTNGVTRTSRRYAQDFFLIDPATSQTASGNAMLSQE